MKRTLLIGIGRWGVNHLRVLKSMPVELFVAGRSEQRLTSVDVSQTYCSTDARSLFSRIDAAVVVTPAPTHFETCSEFPEIRRDGMDDESLIVLEYDQVDKSPIRATIEAGYHVPVKFREVTIVATDSSAVCDYNVAQYKISKCRLSLSKRKGRGRISIPIFVNKPQPLPS